MIALGAFWLSFTALADLAERSGIASGQAWAWPLIVDGIIVVATVAVVALAGHRSAWYPWLLLIAGAVVSVTGNAIHAVVAADADVPAVLAGAVAAVPPVVLLAITHLTVILTRSTPMPTRAASADTAEAGTADGTGAPPPMAGDSAPGVPPDSAALPALEPVLAGASTRAVSPVEGGWGADRRVVAAGLRREGWSNKAIARHLGVHPSTVGRWFPQLPTDGGGDAPDEHTTSTEEGRP